MYHHHLLPMRLLLTTVLLPFSFALLAQEVVFQGSFEADSRWTTFEGDWEIVKKEGKFLVKFSDNFEAKEAPDLKVFLSKRDFDDISGKNAADKSQSVLVAPLISYEGKMQFEIPENIDPAYFRSIIVHCEQYAKLWGGSPLRK